MTIAWEDPPGNRSDRATSYSEVLKALQQHPGRWGLVHEQKEDETEPQARAKMPSIKRAALKLGVAIEATGRLVDGRVKIYARVLE